MALNLNTRTLHPKVWKLKILGEKTIDGIRQNNLYFMSQRPSSQFLFEDVSLKKKSRKQQHPSICVFEYLVSSVNVRKSHHIEEDVEVMSLSDNVGNMQH